MHWMNVAGNHIYYSFENGGVPACFGDKIHKDDIKAEHAVSVPEKLIDRYMKKYHVDSVSAEYMNSLYVTSNYLLPKNFCAFHSVAIKVNGKAYLISADSGVGKTTQYVNLKHLYGDWISIINGDKPFLQFLDDGRIIVHSSPWRGKENYGSEESGVLAGIIFLRQYKRNILSKPALDEMVMYGLSKFLYYPDCEETVRKVADLVRRLLTSVPVYLFDNTGDLKSSELLYKTVMCGGDDDM